MNKIIAGLRQALSFAKGETDAARMHVYSSCYHCGNVTKMVDGSELCGEHKPCSPQ